MEPNKSIEIIENLEKGNFCTVKFPLTETNSLLITTMYMGEDSEGHYSFFDNGGITGRFAVSKEYLQRGKVYISEEYDEEKALELHSKFKLQQEKKHNKEREIR